MLENAFCLYAMRTNSWRQWATLTHTYNRMAAIRVLSVFFRVRSFAGVAIAVAVVAFFFSFLFLQQSHTRAHFTVKLDEVFFSLSCSLLFLRFLFCSRDNFWRSMQKTMLWIHSDTYNFHWNCDTAEKFLVFCTFLSAECMCISLFLSLPMSTNILAFK